MTLPGLVLLGAEDIRRSLPPRDAVEAIETALHRGLDPAADPVRVVVPAAAGQVLLMPSEGGAWAGVKVVTIGPDNPRHGRPRIQGLYLLFDARTLTPVAVLDGAALTTLRTPAVSVAAVRPLLLAGDRPVRVAVFGAGPQAVGHVETLAAVLAGRRPVAEVTYLVRRPDAVEHGPDAVEHGPDAVATRVLRSSGAQADDVVAAADVIICATTARTPLFDSSLVTDDAVVIAVGSHEPQAREVDGALAARALVIVEDVATALRESGDVILAVGEGRLRAADLVPMADVVTGRRPLEPGRPVLFTSTGMAWEDLVVASAVHERSGRA